MAVHVVVPVFNRLKMTQSLVACLRKQVLSEPLHILIVDDGSTDGTDAWLAMQNDIEVLNGDGSLFWGGAVDLALRHLRARADTKDWVLLINNDATITQDFTRNLLDAAQAYAPAAVGSVIRDKDDRTRLMSIGPCINAWRFLTRDFLDSTRVRSVPNAVMKADALSGRGALFPMVSLIAAGGMRPRILPHYLADYELSLRVRKSGWQLFILPTVAVYSRDDYGSMQRPSTWRDKLFSVRSPFYILASAVFWWEASNWLQRLTLPLRLLLFILFPGLRRLQS